MYPATRVQIMDEAVCISHSANRLQKMYLSFFNDISTFVGYLNVIFAEEPLSYYLTQQLDGEKGFILSQRVLIRKGR